MRQHTITLTLDDVALLSRALQLLAECAGGSLDGSVPAPRRFESWAERFAASRQQRIAALLTAQQAIRILQQHAATLPDDAS